MRKNTGIRTTAKISTWQQKIRVCTFSSGCPKRLYLFPLVPGGTVRLCLSPGTATLRSTLNSRQQEGFWHWKTTTRPKGAGRVHWGFWRTVWKLNKTDPQFLMYSILRIFLLKWQSYCSCLEEKNKNKETKGKHVKWTHLPLAKRQVLYPRSQSLRSRSGARHCFLFLTSHLSSCSFLSLLAELP